MDDENTPKATATVGVAVDNGWIRTVVDEAARLLNADGGRLLEVIDAASARQCHEWAGYEGFVYDPDQLGGDTVAVINEIDALMIDGDEERADPSLREQLDAYLRRCRDRPTTLGNERIG